LRNKETVVELNSIAVNIVTNRISFIIDKVIKRRQSISGN
jgi:hypothetical protein